MLLGIKYCIVFHNKQKTESATVHSYAQMSYGLVDTSEPRMKKSHINWTINLRDTRKTFPALYGRMDT